MVEVKAGLTGDELVVKQPSGALRDGRAANVRITE
jgi:hypothetical protein